MSNNYDGKQNIEHTISICEICANKIYNPLHQLHFQVDDLTAAFTEDTNTKPDNSIRRHSANEISPRLEEYPDILGIDHICEIFKIGRNSAYSMLQNNRINHIKIGRCYKIPKQAVLALINQC
jgi:excisionase family DNA binding protein